MPKQTSLPLTYRYHGKDWKENELRAAMGWEAHRLAEFGDTKTFPMEDVCSWIGHIVSARLAAQDDTETFATDD